MNVQSRRELKVSADIIYGYVMNSLSCVLQRGLANSINGNTQRTPYANCAQRLRNCSEDYVANVEIFWKISCFVSGEISRHWCIFGNRKDVGVSIQSKFTQYLADARLENFKSLLVGPLVHYGAWHTSLTNADGGRWLTVVPRMPKFKFDNAQFETSLRDRLFSPIRKLVAGTICSCNQTPRVRVDATGHHFMTACGMHGTRHDQHNMLVLELSQMTAYFFYFFWIHHPSWAAWLLSRNGKYWGKTRSDYQ
jgi:hypothetical protein